MSRATNQQLNEAVEFQNLNNLTILMREWDSTESTGQLF